MLQWDADRSYCRGVIGIAAMSKARKDPRAPMGGCSSAEMADTGIILSRSAGMGAASLT
jgi:hypothetical protein